MNGSGLTDWRSTVGSTQFTVGPGNFLGSCPLHDLRVQGCSTSLWHHHEGGLERGLGRQALKVMHVGQRKSCSHAFEEMRKQKVSLREWEREIWTWHWWPAVIPVTTGTDMKALEFPGLSIFQKHHLFSNIFWNHLWPGVFSSMYGFLHISVQKDYL
jgi:hypothetical protein